MKFGHLEVEQPYELGLINHGYLTTYPNWDDPPSRAPALHDLYFLKSSSKTLAFSPQNKAKNSKQNKGPKIPHFRVVTFLGSFKWMEMVIANDIFNVMICFHDPTDSQTI